MTSSAPSVRGTTLAAPLLLATYAVTRWWDGRDGGHGPGVAWTVGHVAFLLGILCLGYVLVSANMTVAAVGHRRTGAVAGMLGVVGVGLFVWVIIGDLVEEFGDAYGLPGLLMNVGPLTFLAGLVAPLVVLVVLGRLPWVSPLFTVIAFVVLAVDLDLLLLAAVLFGVALHPLPGALDRTGARHP